MKILAIDSSGLVASVALWEGDILQAEYTVNFKKTHSQTLLPMLDEIIRMTETDKGSIEAIAISSGPGSFTGLRIGSATAKGLGLALGVPLISVPTLDALAYQCYGAAGLICPIMDARRSQVYTGLYRFGADGFEVVEPSMAISVAELAEKLNAYGETVLMLGDGVPVYREQLSELCRVSLDFAPGFMSKQRAGAVAGLGAVYAAQGKLESAEQHAPEYLRVSQAERERAARLGIAPEAATEGICYRVMTVEDTAEVAKIEAVNFSSPWKEEDFQNMCARPEFCQVVAELSGRVIGYACARTVLDEADILTIAVAESDRSHGIGGGLLKNLKTICADRGIARLQLEVRESNACARHVYERDGFMIDGKRPGFYSKPVEDAILMSCALKG